MSNIFLLVLSFFLSLEVVSASSNKFFEDRYRGWHWFEEIEIKSKKEQEKQEQISKEARIAKYAKARKEVEEFAAELEALRYMMIRYPKSVEHARAYKQKEAIMMDNAIILADTSRMVNFRYPEEQDLIENPTNLYGRRIKQEIDHKNNIEQIKKLAGDIELFFFFSGTCPYCSNVEPILNDFVKFYGFKVEAVSVDGSLSKFFKTHEDKGLAVALGLTKTPTIIAVTNDSKHRFELGRGATSFSELEDSALLAVKYLAQVNQLQENKGSNQGSNQ